MEIILSFSVLIVLLPTFWAILGLINSILYFKTLDSEIKRNFYISQVEGRIIFHCRCDSLFSSLFPYETVSYYVEFSPSSKKLNGVFIHPKPQKKTKEIKQKLFMNEVGEFLMNHISKQHPEYFI